MNQIYDIYIQWRNRKIRVPSGKNKNRTPKNVCQSKHMHIIPFIPKH